MIRKATQQDIDATAAIYAAIHSEEELCRVSIGWNRNIYPTRRTAEEALAANDLFVMEIDGTIIATAIINQKQVPCYSSVKWKHLADDSQVMVLHTLTVDPRLPKSVYGRAFVEFYENYALTNGCHYLRIDTNVINRRARQMYAHLGYDEIDIVPTTFNGIEGVLLVCLEKKI